MRPVSLKFIREFFKLQSSSGIILFFAALVAIVVANSRFSYLNQVFNVRLHFSIARFSLEKPLLFWINEGLMTLFFLLVGLEIKREIRVGELNSWNKALLPAIAAFGGMLIPALIYVFFNKNSATIQGWGIPTATDIAFSLGILSLLGSRIPVSLKVFLTALAIFDDIGAILIIAVYYSHHIAVRFLLLALMIVIVLMFINRYKKFYVSINVVLGILLWVCILKSGIHATLSGIILAMVIPSQAKTNVKKTPLTKAEECLHPYVAYGVLPLFALANSGLSLKGLNAEAFLSPVFLGIALGLFFGKQIGIFVFSWLSVKLGWAKLPSKTHWVDIYGIALIAGVGFTMSLFIGAMAFSSSTYNASIRLGVILGSLLSGILGYLVLRLFIKTKP